MFEPVSRFSGGEKARLTLALLVARRPNLLLLDEPTNHLDLDMRHALDLALQGFEGGLVVVSHDRHLIKSVADTLWLVADGRLQVFDGDLDDYQRWLKERARAAAPVESAALERTPRSARAPRDALAALRREMEQIERRISSITSELASIGSDEASSGDAWRVARRVRLARDAAALEERWMEVGAELESTEAGAHGG